MPVMIQPPNLAQCLKWEQENRFSRDTVTVKSGNSLALLAVIAKQTLTIPATGSAGANTGNGTCTGVSGAAITGIETFTLTCIAAAADGGIFSVVGSICGRLADAEAGVAYTSNYINFIINDGAADFILGDSFTIPVTAGDNKVRPLDPDAVDGSQHAAGFMVAPCDASLADAKGVAVVRDAIIVPTKLVWPAGITEEQKSAALEELTKLKIVIRDET